MATQVTYAPSTVAARSRAQSANGRAAIISTLEGLRFQSQPALFAALALAAGIAVSYRFWIGPAWLIVAGIMPMSILAGCLRSRSRLALAPLLAAWVLLGLCVAEIRPRPTAQPQLVAMADGAKHSVEGEIVRFGPVRTIESLKPFSSDRRPEQDLSVQLAVTSVDGNHIAPAGLRLSIYAPAGNPIAPVQCGDRMTVHTTLKLPSSIAIRACGTLATG